MPAIHCETLVHNMDGFPVFMRHAANRIATSDQATPGVEGYIFDGVNGSQMAFWTCQRTAVSQAYAHDYDEYMVVVQGCYTLIIDGVRIPLNPGEEYFIPKGTVHAGEVVAGTRTFMHLADTEQVGSMNSCGPRYLVLSDAIGGRVRHEKSPSQKRFGRWESFLLTPQNEVREHSRISGIARASGAAQAAPLELAQSGATADQAVTGRYPKPEEKDDASHRLIG